MKIPYLKKIYFWVISHRKQLVWLYQAVVEAMLDWDLWNIEGQKFWCEYQKIHSWVRLVLGIDTFFRYRYFSILGFNTKFSYRYYSIPIHETHFKEAILFDTDLWYRYFSLYILFMCLCLPQAIFQTPFSRFLATNGTNIFQNPFVIFLTHGNQINPEILSVFLPHL